MINVNAMGDACPIPVVKTKKAIDALTGAEVVETLVDNEIAVSNLLKLAQSMNCEAKSEKRGEGEYAVTITVGAKEPEKAGECCCGGHHGGHHSPKKVVVAIGSDKMGDGAEELGKTLMKGFIYALSQQDVQPATILFYNGGAALSCEGSPALEDLKAMAERGVEILTCGTCLNFYGLAEKRAVGEVTNMYSIVEKLTGADLVVKP